MVLKIFLELSIIILLSMVLGHELVRNRSIFLNTLRQLNVAYNPLIKRNPRISDDSEYFYRGFQQCKELNLSSIGSFILLFFCVTAFLGWKFSWFGCFKSSKQGINLVPPPSPHQVLPHLIRLHQLLSGLLQPAGVPYPLSACPSLVPLVSLWSSIGMPEQEGACSKYLEEHSEELEEAVRNVLDLIEERKSSEWNPYRRSPLTRASHGVHALEMTPSTPRNSVNGDFIYPFSRQTATPPMKRSDGPQDSMTVVEEGISSSQSYVVIPKIKKSKRGRVMNIEIEFESEKEECACD